MAQFMHESLPAGFKRILARVSLLLFSALPAFTPLAAQGTEGARLPAPASAAEREEMVDLLNIDLQPDIRLFTVLAALNAAGFDFEVPGKQMSPLRARLRDELASLDSDTRRRLRIHLGLHRRGDARSMQTAYTSLALLIQGPPEFKLRPDAPTIPWDVQEILGFEELLPDFYQKARIEELWTRFRPEYEKELEAYRPVIRAAIQQALDYLRIPPRVVLDRRVVIMADLLSHRDVVNARNLERTYYLVLGPAESPTSNLVQVQHEYLHFLVDPVVEKHAGLVMKEREHLQIAEIQPGLSRDFRGRFLLIVGESLIEAILHRLHPPAEMDSETVALFRRGLVYFPFFHRELQKFEQTEEIQLPVYLEQVFSRLGEADLAGEQRRIGEIESRLQSERQAREDAAAQEQAAFEHREEVRSLLREAGELMAGGSYHEAREALRRLVDIDPQNGNAQFYLAQAAAQLGEHDTAAAHYAQAETASDVEVWVRAWSAVRLGRFYAHQGDFARARAKLESVLRMEGDLRGAAEEARASLELLPPPE